MKHEVLLADHATLFEHPGGAAIVCDIGDSPPGPIALGLSLLAEAMVDEVIVRPEVGAWVVRLRAAEAAGAVQVRRYAERRFEVELGEHALGALRAYFLRAYRDGQPEVAHVDLAGEWRTGGACVLTIQARGR